MTIQQLKYVVALDRHKHFVKAAQSCFVAQPTLTLQVKKLEEEISFILFDRNSKPLKTTPMGAEFVEKAKKILYEIEQLKESVNNSKNNMDGQFRVGIIPTLLPYLLPLFIADFIDNFPDTQLIIDELQSEIIIERLHNKELDLALLATPLEEPSLREIPLFYEPFLMYANQDEDLLKNKHISTHQLDAQKLWILQKGHCFRNQTLNVCGLDDVQLKKRVSLEGGSIDTLKRMVQTLSGYTLIPELSYQEQVDQAFVTSFRDPKPVREISLVVHQHFTRERLIHELRSTILKHIPEHYQKNTRMKTINWR